MEAVKSFFATNCDLAESETAEFVYWVEPESAADTAHALKVKGIIESMDGPEKKKLQRHARVALSSAC